MRAMRLERADPALLVAEDDDLLAEELLLPRQVLELVGQAHRLPIAAQQFAHRAARLNASQLVIRRWHLTSISRFHRTPPCPAGMNPRTKCKRRSGCGVNSRPRRYACFETRPLGRSSAWGMFLMAYTK